MSLPLRLLAVVLAPVLIASAPHPQAQHEWARTHDLAVRPVPGRVVRVFAPPAARFGAGHRGVDLRAAAREPVVAAMGGTVTFAGLVAGVGWVTVDHGGGLETTYGPIAPRIVTAGQVVARGGWLGFVARDADHLDWGARLHGGYIDPLSLLGGWETYLTTEPAPGELSPLGGAGASLGTTPPRLRWPVRGPATSGFGPRVHPVTGRRRMHNGLDIAAPAGRPIQAAAPGIVTFAGPLGGYGGTVTIDHGGGVSTLYAHQSAITVRPGDRVRAGEPVGRVGSTGISTGPHLHFEVRVDGAARDPAGWLR